jgi:hypothetical protein
MKKHCIFVFLFTVTTCLSFAQDTVVAVSKNRFANFDFGIGYLHTDLGNVNSFLSSYGYKPITEDFIALSFSPSFSVKRFVFRGEYTFQLGVTRKEADNMTTTFRGRHTTIAVGYVILQKPGFRLYPYAGLGSFTSQLAIREKTTVSNLDDLVNNQQRGFHLFYSNAMIDVGFQMDKMISLKNRRWDCPQSSRFMTIGLRAGYLFGPSNVKGRFNQTVVEGAPTYSPKGPYFKLIFGFATKMRDLKWRK